MRVFDIYSSVYFGVRCRDNEAPIPCVICLVKGSSTFTFDSCANPLKSSVFSKCIIRLTVLISLPPTTAFKVPDIFISLSYHKRPRKILFFHENFYDDYASLSSFFFRLRPDPPPNPNVGA